MTMTAPPPAGPSQPGGAGGVSPIVDVIGLKFAAATVDDLPALIFDFVVPAGYPPMPLIRLVMDGEAVEPLRDGIAEAAEAALVASGWKPLAEVVCAGTCGRKLFGEMAERGVCRSCQPDTPETQPGEASPDA